MAELTSYQYYGLVGQGVSQVSSSLVQGFGAEAALEAQAGGYGMSAEMLDIQAEQELINAEAQANVRMSQFNQSAAANVAITASMGKTGENTTISDANYAAAVKDVSLMKREGRIKSISARSGASAKRSAAKQSKIAAKSAAKQGIFGAISGVSTAVGSYSMLGGSRTLMKGSNRTAANNWKGVS